MSWEAVQWANRQRLRLPQEQLVLLILANCADPDGVAFSAWRGKDHWWRYLMDRTRLGRSSVFRHLSTLEKIGLAVRADLLLADGTKRPTIHLQMDKAYDIAAEDQDTGEAFEPDIEAAESVPPVGLSPAHGTEASPAHGTESVPPVGPHIESNTGSKDSPPPPPRGGSQVELDPDLEADVAEAARVYPIPIASMVRFRAVMAALPADVRRSRVLPAMAAYASWHAELERKGKSRNVKDAHRWVRDADYESFAARGQEMRAADAMARVRVDSPEGRAYAALCRLARTTPFESSGLYVLRQPLSPQALALMHAPDPSQWEFIPAIKVNQVKAWDELIARELRGKARPMLVSDVLRKGLGILAPWPWPPRKDGSLSGTGPPASLETQDDIAFQQEQFDKAG